jgi:uncharacterized membrane protein YdbT with pleckstrin-like domain
MEEKTVFKGNPSHWTYFTHYLIGTILLLPSFGISLLYILYKYLWLRFWTIEITNQRIIQETGILSKNTDEVELFRVKDIKLNQPFFLRLFGLSNIILETSDKSHPYKTIPGVRDGKNLREEIRVFVEKRREEKGVKETDFR